MTVTAQEKRIRRLVDKIRNDADTKTVGLTFQGKIVVGKFVDKDKPTYLDSMNAFYAQKFCDKYSPYKG